jgi:hypothetical protein
MLLTVIMPSKLDVTVIARASAELPPTICIVVTIFLLDCNSAPGIWSHVFSKNDKCLVFSATS